MALVSILLVIAIILVAILAMKILHSVLKATITVILLLLVVGVIFSFFVVKDANDFKTTFKEEPTTYVLIADDGSAYTGFQALAFNFSTFEDKSVSEINEIIDEGSEGKIFLFHEEALVLPEENETLMAEMTGSDNESIRSLSFKIALFNTIKKEGPLFLLHHVKDGSLEIMPRTIIIKTITFAPKKFFTSFSDKLRTGKEYVVDKTISVKDKAESLVHKEQNNASVSENESMNESQTA